VAYLVHEGHPATPPYGLYVPAGILFKGQKPSNYAEPAENQPPFGGQWGMFSWQSEDNAWKPHADITKGANLLNWVLGFSARFAEGV
jgi:hypothetical protein